MKRLTSPVKRLLLACVVLCAVFIFSPKIVNASCPGCSQDSVPNRVPMGIFQKLDASTHLETVHWECPECHTIYTDDEYPEIHDRKPHNWADKAPTKETDSAGNIYTVYVRYCTDCGQESVNKVLSHHCDYISYKKTYSNITTKQHTVTSYGKCSCGKTNKTKKKEAHKFVTTKKTYKKISASTHLLTKYQKCACGKTRTVKSKVKHSCTTYVSSTRKYADPTYHTVIKKYKCSCGAIVKKKTKEKHNLVKGVCSKCTYPKKSAFTAAVNKTYCFTGNPWIKIKIAKNGYIRVKHNGSKCVLYNSKKKAYGASYENIYAVKKGTYYIRISKKGNKYFSYKFGTSAAKPSGMSTAKQIELNKGIYIVAYPSKKDQYFYYKLVLDHDQTIEYDGWTSLKTYHNCYYSIMDANGDPYDRDNGVFNLTAGTYYIRVDVPKFSATKMKKYTGTVLYLKFIPVS